MANKKYNTATLLKKLLDGEYEGREMIFWLETNMIARDWTLEELAKRSGVSKQAVQQHIKGRVNISGPQILAYTAAFDGVGYLSDYLDIIKKLRNRDKEES